MKSEPLFGAVILAAGNGSRMGVPKLTLTLRGRSYLEVVLDRVRTAGIGDIVVVVQPRFTEFAARAVPGAAVAVNSRPERGMSSSLHRGVKMLGGVSAVMVIPVDHPLVRTETYAALIGKAIEFPECVVKPVWRGRPGHPVILPWKLASKVPAGDIRGGLSRFIRDSGIRQVLLPVPDPGILRNFNTPRDIGAAVMEAAG